MDRELIEFYKHELALLEENAAAFADEYPGIADRLGGLVKGREQIDPMIEGLLQGSAYLAARVQLKIAHEFPTFTQNIIDQLLPEYLAPVPSFMMAQAQPKYGDPALRDGVSIAAGSLLDAQYLDRDQAVSCTFSLCAPLTMWPFELAKAEYFPAVAPLQGLGLNAGPDTAAGLRLNLRLRTTARAADEPADDGISDDPLSRVAGCALDVLPVQFLGSEADAVMLYEQMFAHLKGVHLRYLDEFGDPHFIALDRECVTQPGFASDEMLMPRDARIHRGYVILQEYFVFPRKFMGVRLSGLREALAKVQRRSFDLIFTFDQSMPRLAAAIEAPFFSLYTAPAVNLFQKTMDRVQLRSNQHEYLIVPDRTQYRQHEVQKILDVFIHFPRRADKIRVHQLYRATLSDADDVNEFFYSIRRLPRNRSTEERRTGISDDYLGSDTYISVSPPAAANTGSEYPELSVRALCSNRHLPKNLPVGSGGADFKFRDDTSLDVAAVIRPSAPRNAPILWRHDNPHHRGMGPVAWRLINLLSLNHMGLTEEDGRGMRELLALFADLGDPAIEKRIRSLRSVEAREVIRRFQQRAGVGAARGLEINLTFEDKAFEGSGVFLMGAVLDRVLAEFVSMNHFVQTIIHTVERGKVAQWPPRSGTRSAL